MPTSIPVLYPPFPATVQVSVGLVEEAGKAADEMESEARIAPLQFRAEMLAAVRAARRDLANKQQQLTRARAGRAGSGAGREEGRVGGEATAGQGAGQLDQHRQQVLAGTEILSRTGESLQRAQQVAVETDAVGNEIIGDLGSQREALERSRARLVESDLELSRTRRILRKMYLNVFSNKIILGLIILIEIGILCGVIYWKYGAKR